MTPGPAPLRALILAPAGRDAKITEELLAHHGIASHICSDYSSLRTSLDEGAGLALVVEEILFSSDLLPLQRWVAAQPSWSDFPFIILTRRSGVQEHQAFSTIIDTLGNVTLVERPFRPSSLVSLVQSAIRGRGRQYEARARIEELRASHDHLAIETQALAALNRTSIEIASNHDLKVIVQKVVDTGVELTGATYGAFFFRNAEAALGNMAPYIIAGAPPTDFDGFARLARIAAFESSFGSSPTVRSNNIARDPRLRPPSHRTGALEGQPSYLAAPVSSRTGNVVGVLCFGHSDTGVFDERTERLIEGLAAQAAVAIDNTQLLTDVQRANASLEARVAERTRERDRIWRLSSDLMAVMDPQGRLLATNHAWTTLLGLGIEDLHAKTLVDVAHPDDGSPIRAVLARLTHGVAVLRFESRLRDANGEYRKLAWAVSSEAKRFYAIGRDVTEQRDIEDQLRQSQKMEAIGQLTGGIAHDFNNLLQGITGALDLVARRVQQGRSGEVERLAGAAMASANRAAALTHRLLAFSRRQPIDPKPVEANALVASMEDLLRRTLTEKVQLKLVLSEDLWGTRCDANQLENAILNLGINARDAMPEGGTLTITTKNVELVDGKLERIGNVRPGEYICIAVADTGCGMSADTIAHAFEPFFTTKPMGHGTGLGLSMIYGFARQSEGQAEIQSRLGKGTTVRLYLPRHQRAHDLDAMVDAASDVPPTRRNETVLVIEDEPVVRSMIVELLQELGYRALEAHDGPSGIDVLRSEKRVDLLVTDMGLPGLDGRQVADAARMGQPDLKILFMTGYAENAAKANGFLGPGMELITKPFPLDVLAKRVQQMIRP